MITEIRSSCDNRNSYVPYSDTHYDYLYASDKPMTLDTWTDELDALPTFNGGIKHQHFPYWYDVELVDADGHSVSDPTSAYAAVYCTREFLD
jgi:hypothetical protein